MNYTNYQCEDFVADSYFRQWVKQPDEASSSYWYAFLTAHPEQAEAIWQAAAIVQAVAEATVGLTAPANAAEEATIWQAVSRQIQANEPSTPFSFLSRYRNTGWNWLVAAASILIVLGAGWWVRSRHLPASGNVAPKPVAIQSPISQIEQKNTTPKPRLVSLPDGSSVILKQGSQIRYSTQFDAPRRIVHLTGEAYFEVARNPARPFFVYAHGLVTKVLGTSFNVRAYSADTDVVVTVRSGRVAVFTESDETHRQKVESPALEGIVLTQNQQIVFARRAVALIKPSEISPAIARTVFPLHAASFVFEARPVGEVFDQLADVYGIRILYDKATLGLCRITADLSDESLSEKMLIICKTIEASYKLTNNQLVVSGQGCRP
ncbi:FecR family protein [Spirosoma utsteinense]|uniref:Ferric-dicitrate binding protein FerR (Iron transport regulator) n=1 Tax=Spirosoma utsteinense TaxID=2585773 RepID=A0ABR6W3K4_9BACT|nr:FecR domain-containing protein [Spirosoma utsteinense]MBC3785978.1 ferric-dicitrate binding protein FerR (iron transport regulator) [Spirosoma utsteinense]MBC3790676.1 ferric-dicitrate binding protein FerR (iron transport regulator) [Spirosoma utsteinense]